MNMRNIFFTVMALVIASLFIACGGAAPVANNSVERKPANITAATPAVDPKADEAEIKKLMDTAQAALQKGDADAMEKIYADNYSIVNVDGTKQTKAERLASIRSGEVKYTAFAYSDANIVITPDGNSANVTVKLAMKGRSRENLWMATIT